MRQNKMIILTAKSITALCLLILVTTNSYAVNMQYLKYSPVANFSAEDFELLQTTGKKALKDNKDGERSEWANTDSKNSGSITPINSSTIDGMHCRKVRIENKTESKSGSAIFTFCNVSGDKWKVLK